MTEEVDPKKIAYEKAWNAFINSPLWDKKHSELSLSERQRLDHLADQAHQAYMRLHP
jgi:hypothetical protein